jgi:cell division protein FtsI (penicillin-binding protein 3)
MQNNFVSSIKRINFFYISIVLVVAIIGLRLFYIQIIQGDYYQNLATASQLKQYEIPAERGGLYAYDGNEIVPLVLNETRYRITADPSLVADSADTAIKMSEVLGISANEIQEKIESDSRYEILASQQTREVRDAVTDLKLPGIFTNERQSLRAYIQGSIAAQTLGFVNDAGEGNYGVEQYLDDELTGTPGRVRALTDQNNVPLLATDENVLTDPVDGKDIVLTLDVSMQRQVEAILKSGLENAISDSGSIIVIDPNSGAIKAMATYPTYDPSEFRKVAEEDIGLFINTAVSTPLEPGSIMKTLTAAAALNSGSVQKDQTYFDSGSFDADDATITNVVESGGAGTRSVSDILRLSLNTGATWLLMQMGDGELNEKGRKVWYDYMVNRYQFGKPTGIEQGSGTEAAGVVPDPEEGFGLNIRYANTSFGQGMTVTPIQMAAAVSSVVNGGTYYRPHLTSGELIDEQLVAKDPEVVNGNVVSSATSNTLIDYMKNVVNNNLVSAKRDGYQVGGKTGTAEVADPAGGYFEDIFNGTYVGFVGGDRPEYVIMVRVDEPEIPGYAGSRAAAPIFSDVANMLIDNFTIPRVSI